MSGIRVLLLKENMNFDEIRVCRSGLLLRFAALMWYLLNTFVESFKQTIIFCMFHRFHFYYSYFIFPFFPLISSEICVY